MSDKTPQQVIIDLPNAENNASVPYDAVTVGAIEPHDIPEEGESAVVITAVQGKGYKDNRKITFTRLDLTQLFTNAGLTTVTLKTEAATIHGLVPDLKTQFGMIVTPADLVDGPIVYDGAGEAAIDLLAAPNSLLYKGTLDLFLAPKIDGAIPLQDVFAITVMDGLNYPLSSVAHLELIAIAQNVDLGGPEVTQDGTMRAGIGNPAGSFTTADNGELFLSVAARRFNDVILIEPEDGVYHIPLDVEQDWNIPFSLRVNKPAGVGEDAITELYDAYLSIESLDHDESLTFQVIPGQAGYNLRSQDGLITITNGFTSTDGVVLQDIQRLSAYATYFPSHTKNEAGALLGNFKVVLTGRRKNSITPRVNAAIAVSVTANPIA